MSRTRCYYCGGLLIVGGDHDIEDHEEFDMETNLSCENCDAHVMYYHPKSKIEENS